MRILGPLILAAITITATGCQHRHRPRETALTHVVIFNLADPTQTDALIEACDRYLTDIDAVESYACGQHFDTGRSVVLTDYQVALVVGFNSPADYSAYLQSQQHTAFLDEWSSRISEIRIFDFQDPRITP